MANSFENKTFLFTGKLVHMKREEAEAKVEALGGKAVSGVSKNLSVLVSTSETSAKWTKAQELNSKGANIQLWTEEQFMAELEKAESSNDGKAEEKKPVADNAEEAKTQTKAGSKAKPKKSVAKCSKFEGMRPFIIEIETLKNNVKFECKINSENCKPEDIEYEVLCSDSEKEKYKLFQGDKAFTHSFKQQGKYKISFRGNLPGLFIRDKEKTYRLTDVCQWGDIVWINMKEMFGAWGFGAWGSRCCVFYNISADDKPDLSRVTSLNSMFYGSICMNAPLEKWDVSNVTNMQDMFAGAESFNQPLEKWDVSNVTDMKEMFHGAKSFNQPLEKWDVSNVTDMKEMFHGAKSFNQPLEKWDVSNVTNMKSMFFSAESFNQPLEKWDVSNVTNMALMFSFAKSFNQPLEKWDVSNVTNMESMFYSAKSFNRPLEKWDVSNVTDMYGMFSLAKSFNQPLEKWDVSNVTNMALMFYSAKSFNQPLEKWDVSNVTNMIQMFWDAFSFNQPLEKWDVSNVTGMYGMFDGASSFNQPKPKLTAKQLEKLNKDLLEAVDNSKPSIETIKSLIDAGADVNAKDNFGKTPLHPTDIYANVAQVLIDAGADVNARSNDGKTPLHWCYFAKTAQVFIDAGADVNAKDEDGNTPLHYCEHYDVAKVLVDAGADVNAENNYGETPLDYGVDLWEDEDIEDLLVNAGAVRHKDVDDEEDVDDERILELVKKHLAEAAPKPMVHIEIINKLKEDGLPATMPFTAHFNDLMSCWVKKGIIVRVERGVYKLAGLNNNTENLTNNKAESSNDGKAEEKKPVADNAEEAKNQSKAGSKAKPKKSVAKCSKFEGMRPFIIEIETLKDNVKFKIEINSENCKAEDIEYEVLCSDSEKEKYKLFHGDKAFTHSFKQQGKYKISFRGNLPGLFIRDKEKSHRLTDVCQWGDIVWINMKEMFGSYGLGCEFYNISADDIPDLSRVTSLANMFEYSKSMNAPLEKWDVSNVTDMSCMFQGAESFNQPLEKWDVSNVTNMSWMFVYAKSFNQPLEKWDVSKVTDMNCMFDGASSFNQSLEKWDVSNVTDMSGMFWKASSFNQPLEKWDVSKVTDMSSMFRDASLFNQPLENWDVSKVTNMPRMFLDASSFNQPLEKWDVSKVKEKKDIFEDAVAMKNLPSWLNNK